MRNLFILVLSLISISAFAKPYQIGSGGETGSYYAMVNDVIDVCEIAGTELVNSVQELGSLGNIDDMRNKKLHAGVMQFDALYDMSKQDKKRISKKKWSIIAGLHEEAVHLIFPKSWKPQSKKSFWAKSWEKATGQKPLIIDVNILKDQKVVAWGGSVSTAQAMSNALGLNMKIGAIAPAAAESSKHPLVIVGGAPNTSVQKLLDSGKYYLVNINYDAFRGKAEFYTQQEVSYKVNGKIKSIQTLAVRAVLVGKVSRNKKKNVMKEELATCINQAIPMLAEEDDSHVNWESAADLLQEEEEVDWNYFNHTDTVYIEEE